MEVVGSVFRINSGADSDSGIPGPFRVSTSIPESNSIPIAEPISE